MLRQLRSGQTMKTIMWIVAASFFIGFIILSDGLNVGRGGGAPQATSVGSINGFDIPPEYYRGVLNQLVESERARSPLADLRTSDYERLEELAWDNIITEVVIRQEADRLGLQTQDDEVIAAMTLSPPQFVRQRFTGENGEFDAAAYQRALSDPNYPWLQDELYVRDLVRVQKLRQMVYARASVGEAEVREEYMRRSMPVTVRYVGQRWSNIDLGDYEPSDEELRAFYEQHPDTYSRGEHVLLEALRVPKSASELDREELLLEANAMLDELRDLSGFGALAELYSESPSASNGGQLGWVKRSGLPTEVADAAWALEVGQRTTPIVTQRGVHVVQVDSVRTDADGSESRFLRELFLALEPSRDTLDSLNQLALDVADAARDGFASAAERFGLEVETLQPLETSGFLPGFGFSVRLRKWAFDAKKGDVGGPFEGDDAHLIVHVVEHRTASPRPFEEVKGRVRAGVIEERKKREARRTMQAVVDAVRGGATFADAAQAQSLTLETPEPFTYYEGTPGPGGANAFTAAAYALLPGQTSPVVETTNGAYVVELVQRDAFDEEAYRAERDTHYQSLLGRRATQIYEAWLEQLRNSAEIVDRRNPQA